jgi:membrane-associated phospholipid phosphatase
MTDVGRVNGALAWRRFALCAYGVAVVLFAAVHGVPEGRTELMAIVVAGLALAVWGSGPGRARQMLLDWLPFTLVLSVYDLSRGLASVVSLPIHESDVVSAERGLFGGTVPTVWLQQHFYDPSRVHWYDAVATLVYTSHFVATPIVAAVLWLRNRRVWLRYVSRVVLLSFGALVTYIVFPEAPPWYAARDHLLPPVARLSARGWIWLRAGNVEQVLDGAQRDGSNPVAAMPSLHTAFAVLLALFLIAQLRTRWRYLLWLYPALMGLVLVYTGEHYVLDVIAGAGYALVAHVLVSRWEARRRVARPTLTAEPARAALPDTAVVGA